MSFSINTSSGASIELAKIKDRFHGEQLVISVDQTSNIRNGDGSVMVTVTNQEVKELIAMLNEYLTITEGVTYVVLAAPLLHENVIVSVKSDDQTTS